MRSVLLSAGLCLAVSLAFAQKPNTQPLDVRTGLWQVTTNGGVSGLNGVKDLPPEMQAKLDQMTPEQRAKVEAMMKNSYGGGPRTRSYKKCVTAKDLNSSAFSDTKCNWTVLSSTSRETDVKGSSCEAGKNEGVNVSDLHVKIQALDSENVKGSVNGMATGSGHNYPINYAYTAKWLGTTCPSGTD